MPIESNPNDIDHDFDNEADDDGNSNADTAYAGRAGASGADPRYRLLTPATDSLAHNVLARCLTAAQKALLRGEGSLAVVIQAPGPTWVAPLADAVRSYSNWAVVEARDGANAREDKPNKGGEKIAVALAKGGRCVGIAPNPASQLPSALTGAADLVIKVSINDAAIIETIKEATGRRPRNYPPGLCGGLDANDIMAAIRVGGKSGAAVARLRAAVKARTVLDADLASAPAFATLHGFGPAKVWGTDLIADLGDWRKGKINFDSISSRAILASPPGMGKTTYVRSLAQAAGVPLIATAVSMWFAGSAGNLDAIVKCVDESFSAARALDVSILFIDEIDAIPNRATMDARHREWWVPVVTHILLCLDSAISGANSKTIIIGATNHPEHLDSALTRPGRLDQILFIDPHLDEDARVGILRAHLRGDLANEDLSPAARLASGMTGADLAEAVKKARRVARVANRPMVVTDLAQAIAPTDRRGAEDLRITAVHEAGHVMARLAVGHTVCSVSIVEYGDSGGATVAGGLTGVPTRAQLEEVIVVLLAGRAAEQTILGFVTTGAGGAADSDLARGTRMAAGIHGSYGLGDSLVWRGPAFDPSRPGLDPGLRALVEADLARLYARALHLVRARRPAVEAIAKRLLRDRFLNADDIRQIVDRADPSMIDDLNSAKGALQ